MSEKQEQYPRFRVGAQIEHIILLLSFTVLAVTGLAQRFVETGIGDWLVTIMGGIEIFNKLPGACSNLDQIFRVGGTYLYPYRGSAVVKGTIRIFIPFVTN